MRKTRNKKIPLKQTLKTKKNHEAGKLTIAEASTEEALLSRPECSAPHPSAFHAVSTPDPIEQGFVFGSAKSRDFEGISSIMHERK